VRRWHSRRIFYFLLALFAGGLLGGLATSFLRFSAGVGVLGGALLGLVAIWLIDLQRATKVMNWLENDDAQAQLPQTLKGPVDIWSELARRAVRLMRLRDRQIQSEQQQLQQFLSAMQVAPTGVLLLDENDQVTWGNANAAYYLGLEFPRDYRQHITNLVRRPVFVNYLMQHAYENTLRMEWGHGQQGTLILQVVNYDEQRKLVLIQDITEQERIDQMRRDFVANVSHEMRTPLTVLAGFIETMQNLPLDKGEQAHYLALMAEQSNRMQGLISDLLALAKLEGSPAPGVDSWVPVVLLLEQAEHTARQLSGGQHEISFSKAGSDQIAGEQTELLSALSNLVSNAVRYTPHGSKIAVTWQIEPDGSGLLLVKDNGAGIAKEHIPRLTERFYRVDRSRSRQTGGTGLGLSIVKHVMQRHEGALEIDSILGKGSSFILKFPASRVRHAQVPAEL